jgi:exopolysaccharide production protein ExoZ
MAPSDRRYFVTVQGLRAVAALAIVFSHVAHDGIAAGLDPRGFIARAYTAFPWDAGVDLFFVISGFIIASSSGAFSGQGWAGAGRFFVRRCQRIIPLYWATTFLFLSIALASRGVIHGTMGGAGYIAASFLFIPWPRPDGEMQPALGLGWTLNYEMFFYILFALSLRLPRRRVLPVLAIILLAVVGWGATIRPTNPQLGYWSSPLVLEFCAGLALAWLRDTGLRWPIWLRIAAVPLALWLLHAHAALAESSRVTAWGPAAILLVGAATLGGGPGPAGRWTTRLAILGDASYALYLTHPFIMRGLSVSFHKFHGHSELAGLMYVSIGLVLAQLAALIVHLHVDARVQAWFRNQRARTAHETVQMPGL